MINATEDLWRGHFLGATILLERHRFGCNCSACQPSSWGLGDQYIIGDFEAVIASGAVDPEYRPLFGLSLPISKSWNSWRSLHYRGLDHIYYLRWTMPRCYPWYRSRKRVT